MDDAKKRERVLQILNVLLPARFEELLLLLNVPSFYLSPPSSPQATRAVELIRYLEGERRLDDLHWRLSASLPVAATDTFRQPLGRSLSGAVPSAAGESVSLTVQIVSALNARFEGHAVIRGVTRQEPILHARGPLELDVEDRCLAQEKRIRLSVNDRHALLAQEADWHEDPVVFYYKSTDFATVQLLRAKAHLTGGRPPRVISASGVMVSSERKEIYLHLRDHRSATYAGCLHTFGGGFIPPIDDVPGDADLAFTLTRETHEESASPAIVRRSPILLLVEEIPTAFVQVVFLGVPLELSPTAKTTYEGRAVPVDFRRLRSYLLGSHPWVPSGKLHVLAWLALGAPGCPEADFDGLSPTALFEDVISEIWPAQESARVQF